MEGDFEIFCCITAVALTNAVRQERSKNHSFPAWPMKQRKVYLLKYKHMPDYCRGNTASDTGQNNDALTQSFQLSQMQM
jgi:hypothetical protein